MKYYITKNELGQKTAIQETKGIPVNYVSTVVLPTSADWIRINGKNKDYPAYKVALAVDAGQIKLTDIL